MCSQLPSGIQAFKVARRGRSWPSRTYTVGSGLREHIAVQLRRRVVVKLTTLRRETTNTLPTKPIQKKDTYKDNESHTLTRALRQQIHRYTREPLSNITQALRRQQTKPNAPPRTNGLLLELAMLFLDRGGRSLSLALFRKRRSIRVMFLTMSLDIVTPSRDVQVCQITSSNLTWDSRLHSNG